MRAHWAYLKYVLRHKYFVLLECIRLGILWRGIIHDWDKFLPRQWFPYVHFFYDTEGNKRSVRTKTGYYDPNTGHSTFDFALFLHLKRSCHHWQYWCHPRDMSGLRIFPMSDKARREMLCDWRGAGRAQGTSDVSTWWKANKDKLQLHPDTRKWVEGQLR